MRETLILFIVLTEYCSSLCLFANVSSSLIHREQEEQKNIIS